VPLPLWAGTLWLIVWVLGAAFWAPAFLRRTASRGLQAQGVVGARQVSLERLQHSGVRYEIPLHHVNPREGRLRASTLGSNVAEAGDVDDDGRPDLLVAADGYGSSGGKPGNAPGRVWLLRGAFSPHSTSVSLYESPPGGGVEIRSGFGVPDRFGAFVASAGDVNGDGHDDTLIGMPSAAHPLSENGAVYLLFGQDRYPSTLDLRALRGLGVLLTAPSHGVMLGISGAGVGDVNGDGIDDFALGIPQAITVRNEQRAPRGRVIVIYGSRDLGHLANVERPNYAIDNLPRTVALTIEGVVPNSFFGSSIAALGDVDHDGNDDFGIGAPMHNAAGSIGGAAFVIFGGEDISTGAPNLGAVDPDRFLRIFTGNRGARLGWALAGGRDVTGDGIADLALGAPTAVRENVSNVGFAAVLEGGPRLRELGTTNIDFVGLRLWGLRDSQAGSSIAMVPDRNKDDVDELIVGAPGADRRRGRAYLAFGGDAFEDGLFLEEIDESGGQVFSHSSIDSGPVQLGFSVVGLEDRNRDGSGEVVVGAPAFRPSHDDGIPEGAVYEIFNAEPADGPRNLSCRALSGERVHLSWSLPNRFRVLNVFRSNGDRDFERVASLPGDIALWVDAHVERGRYQYYVEADGDPALRSATCGVNVQAIAPTEIRCDRLPGTNSVRVAWVPNDSQHLRILVNGEVVPELADLPPSVSAVRLELPEQANGDPPYRISVCSRDDETAACAECEIFIGGLTLPTIHDFRCVVDPASPSHAKLSWQPENAYTIYEIKRNGILIARLDARDDAFHDRDVPPFGQVEYGILGLVDRTHAGPISRCELDIRHDGPALKGRVTFDDRSSTPLRRGKVVLYSRALGGRPIGVSGVNASGEFVIPVPENRDGAFDLEYRAEFLETVEIDGPNVWPVFDRDGDPQALDSYTPGDLVATLEDFRLDEIDDFDLRVPLPVIAVTPGRSDIERWSELNDRLLGSDRALLFVSETSGGIVRGAVQIRSDVSLVRRILAHEFGSAPAEFEMVAFGFAGLAARLYAHTSPRCDIRRLVLVGTPNLGTPRALLELRADAAVRPASPVVDTPADLAYKAADEQTSKFLRHFNSRVTKGCSTILHLVAGSAGRAELDGILGCEEHDGRVCVGSALADDDELRYFTGAKLYVVEEDHGTLGTGARSLELLLEDIGLGKRISETEDAAGAGGGAAFDTLGGGGAAADDGETLALGKVTHREIVPGGSDRYFFASDTSGSIIIILNSEDEGSLEFTVTLPSGDIVDGPEAANHNGSYVSYNDGEGNIIQTYKFTAAEPGDYEASIENPPGNPTLKYSIEFHLESPIKLKGVLDSEDIELGKEPIVSAELTNVEQLPPNLELEMTGRWIRPDGSLEVLALNDDGTTGDAIAGDGVFATTLPPMTQPGYHLVEVLANNGPDATFERAAVVQILVRSDLAELGQDFNSGADPIDEDPGGEGGGAGEPPLNESLWVTGSIVSTRGGSVVVLGTLTDLDGNPVAQAGTIFSMQDAEPAGFRIDFDGYDIYGSQRDGPYLLTDVEILDAGVGFVRADHAENAHETAPFDWDDFGLPGGLPFIRADTNGDLQIDLSDAVAILLHLFGGPEGSAAELACENAADVNVDRHVDLSDAVEVINFLFLGLTPTIGYPFPECGQEPGLPCEYYPYCR